MFEPIFRNVFSTAESLDINKTLKEKSGVKWIRDMFGMITSWNVRFGAKKRIQTHSSVGSF